MIKRLFYVGIAFVLSVASPCEAALDVQTLATKNDTNVWFVEDHNVPVVSVVMSFKAGTSQAPEQKVAVASFLSALLVEGAGDLDAKAFHEKLQDLGISLDVGEDLDRLTFSLRTPARSWRQAFDLLKLVLSKPRFDADAFERVKEGLISNLENEKLTPQWQAGTALNDVLYKDHPYGAMMRTAQDIHAINERDVIHFMKNHVAKDGMIVGICGDLKASDVLAATQELETFLPAKGFYKEIKPVDFPQKGVSLSVFTPQPQSVALFYHPGLPTADADYLKLNILSYVLGGSSSQSWLMEELRHKRGLVYGANSFTQNYDAVSLLGASFPSDAKTVDQAVTVTRELFVRMAEKGVSQAELDNAKNFLLGMLPLRLSSSVQIAGTLHGFQVDGRPSDYLNKREALIKGLTLTSLNAFARSFFKPDKLLVAVAGPNGLPSTKMETKP